MEIGSDGRDDGTEAALVVKAEDWAHDESITFTEGEEGSGFCRRGSQVTDSFSEVGRVPPATAGSCVV